MEERGNTWTCPSCGKVMPKYVGTCGCGEPQPFSFDDVPPVFQGDPHAGAIPTTTGSTENKTASNAAPSEPQEELPTGFRNRRRNHSAAPATQMPEITKDESSEDDDRIFDASAFSDAAPTLQSYSPQTTPPVDNTPDPDLDFIKNDNESSMPFGSSNTNNAPIDFNTAPPPAPMRFDDAPPPAPMRFDDAPPPAPMRFDDAPPPAPMRFDAAPPPAPMRFDDAPPPAPMRFDDAPPPAPMKFNDTAPAQQPAAKPEKKHIFGKKAREAEAIRQAEAVVNSRKDIPDNGSTWTCPNCGKVMPKYVGTCGCGEPQPFEF